MPSKDHKRIYFDWHNQKYIALKRIGAEDGIVSKRSQRPKPTTIIKTVLEFFIEIHRSKEMMALKEIEGGTTLDILKRAFLSYSRHLRKPIRAEEPLHRLRADGNTRSEIQRE